MKAYLHWEISRICLTDLTDAHHECLRQVGELDLTREEAEYLYEALGQRLAAWDDLDAGLEEINRTGRLPEKGIPIPERTGRHCCSECYALPGEEHREGCSLEEHGWEGLETRKEMQEFQESLHAQMDKPRDVATGEQVYEFGPADVQHLEPATCEDCFETATVICQGQPRCDICAAKRGGPTYVPTKKRWAELRATKK